MNLQKADLIDILLDSLFGEVQMQVHKELKTLAEDSLEALKIKKVHWVSMYHIDLGIRDVPLCENQNIKIQRTYIDIPDVFENTVQGIIEMEKQIIKDKKELKNYLYRAFTTANNFRESYQLLDPFFQKKMKKVTEFGHIDLHKSTLSQKEIDLFIANTADSKALIKQRCLSNLLLKK